MVLAALTCLDQAAAKGAGTVAVTGTVAAAVTWACTGSMVRALVGGAIGMYASAITTIVQVSLRNEPTRDVQLPAFFAVAITSTVLLYLSAKAVGVTFGVPIALAVCAANVASMVLSLNIF